MRRHLHLARRTIVLASAVAIVLAAVLLMAAAQALPALDRNPARVAAWLSQQAGQPVAFDRVSTDWTRRGPLLRLDNLRIGRGARAFAVGDAEVLVSVYSGLLPGAAFTELRVRNLDLTLERDRDGRWRVRGLPGATVAAQDPFEPLEGLGELHVIGARLRVDAPALGIDAQVPRVDVRLRVDGARVRAGVRAWPAGARVPLDAVLDFDRGTGDGRAHAGAAHVDLAPWSPWLRAAGVGVAAGRGRAQAWARLDAHRVAGLALSTDLRGVQLVAIARPGERVRFDRVAGRARWQATDGGWRLDTSALDVTRAGVRQRLDGVSLAGGATVALLASHADAGPLVAVAALSDRIPPALRDWLRAASPTGTLRDVRIVGRRGGALQARGTVEGLGFARVGGTPGVRGLRATFEGDARAVSLRFDPRADARFDWRPAFDRVQPLALDGEVVAWRGPGGWRVGSPGLHVELGPAGVRARGTLAWQGDGTRPRVDLAAHVERTALPVARQFWVRNRMPAAAVQWLDAALLAGHVEQGRAVLAGDLDDWPFDAGTGRFEATARLVDASVRFQPQWPPVTGLDAQARFDPHGFSVDGRGMLHGVSITGVRADIDRYAGGRLRVEAEGAGDAARLRQLLRDSPVYAQHRETLDNLQASGPANVGFELELPMQPRATTRIAGYLDLEGARLADARYGLRFDGVTGRTRYTGAGFDAEGLRVRQDGQPGRLSLRAGEFVRTSGQVLEGTLDASFPVRGLLDRAPDLAWLRPYLDGRSQWSVGVAIPAGTPGVPAVARLQLRSNLVGTSLDLPAPLRKPAGVPLAAVVETPLPVGSGEVRVALGQLLSLRARTAGGRTGVRVALGGARADVPPAAGLVATGRAPSLDALGWVGVVRGLATPSAPRGNAPATTPAAGFALQRIDVTTSSLELLGATFADARVVVAPAPAGATAVRVDAATLSGAVLVPAARTQPLAGRFERVHWAAAPTATVATGTAPRARAIDPALDPADVPALVFDIDELRYGQALLGNARVRTRPVAGGLRIEDITARSPRQTLNVTGDWTGRGAAMRTRLALDVDSRDIGALLDGFGLKDRVDGGTGTLALQAAWAGSPADFAVAGVDGTLTLDARKGRLLEINPGAGRVLGLLSVAELPRRLTLDFRDFFDKGFAFNRIAGTVRFGDGVARSEAMGITGPAADIDIRGTANLRAQSFDQTVEVRPKPGGLLTVAGAIAGGPVGAAIGAAANAVLQKPLGQMAAKTYRVTGPWKDPKVEVMGKDSSRARAAGGGGDTARSP